MLNLKTPPAPKKKLRLDSEKMVSYRLLLLFSPFFNKMQED